VGAAEELLLDVTTGAGAAVGVAVEQPTSAANPKPSAGMTKKARLNMTQFPQKEDPPTNYAQKTPARASRLPTNFKIF